MIGCVCACCPASPRRRATRLVIVYSLFLLVLGAAIFCLGVWLTVQCREAAKLKAKNAFSIAITRSGFPDRGNPGDNATFPA
jgi:hypothetical protein